VQILGEGPFRPLPSGKTSNEMTVPSRRTRIATACPYIELYGLKDAKTMYRGTFRYGGHCVTWETSCGCRLFRCRGSEQPDDLSISRLHCHSCRSAEPTRYLEKAISENSTLPNNPPVNRKMEPGWDCSIILSPSEHRVESASNILVAAISGKTTVPNPGKRDMVALHATVHRRVSRQKDGEDTRRRSLISEFRTGDTSEWRVRSDFPRLGRGENDPSMRQIKIDGGAYPGRARDIRTDY